MQSMGNAVALQPAASVKRKLVAELEIIRPFDLYKQIASLKKALDVIVNLPRLDDFDVPCLAPQRPCRERVYAVNGGMATPREENEFECTPEELLCLMLMKKIPPSDQREPLEFVEEQNLKSLGRYGGLDEQILMPPRSARFYAIRAPLILNWRQKLYLWGCFARNPHTGQVTGYVGADQGVQEADARRLVVVRY